MKVVGQGSGPPGPPSGGKVSLNALVRQGGVDRGLSFGVKPPAVAKDLLAIATCSPSATTDTVRDRKLY